MRMVRITLAAPSTGAGVLDKSMLHLPLRVWALLSPALSPILEAGDGVRGLGERTVSGSILFRLWVLFHSILILHFPSLFLSFYSVPGANHLLSQPDFGLCQKNLGSNQGLGWLDDLQLHGWESDSGTDIFLKPWSKSNFSDEEMTKLEDLF